MVEFNRSNPGIAQFHSNMTRFGSDRRAEDDAARARLTYENALATDRALRQGIGAIYAEPATGAPPAPLPSQQQAPAPAAPAPAPAPAAAATPPVLGPTVLGPRNPYDAAEGGNIAANTAAASQAVAVHPAPNGAVAATPAPAPAAAPPVSSPAAAPAAAPVNPYAKLQTSLAKAPGSGHSMMQLFAADQTSQRAGAVENRKLQAEGHKLWVQALKDGDVKMAQSIGQQYGLNIPPQIYTDRGMMIDARVAANLSKTMGIKDDQAALFVEAFLKARHEGADQGQAAQKAAASAANGLSGSGKAVHWAVNDKHEVTGFDARGRSIPTGVKARPNKFELYPPAAPGAAGATSKQRQYAQWRIDTLVSSGTPISEAQQIVAAGTAHRPLTASQRLNAANKLLGATDRMGRKIYPNLDAALKAVDAARSGSNAPAAEPAPAAAPAAPAGPSSRLRFNPSSGQLEPVATAQ